MSVRTAVTVNPATKVAAFLAALVGAGVLGAGVGQAVGPLGTEPDPPVHRAPVHDPAPTTPAPHSTSHPLGGS